MISYSEIFLQKLALYAEPDWGLMRLADLGDRGVGFPISMVVQGAVISGVPTNGPAWGKHLDDLTERLIEQVEEHIRGVEEGGVIPSGIETTFKALRETSLEDNIRAASAACDDIEERVADALGDKAEWEPEDLPADLARKFIEARSRHGIVLRDATIQAGLGATFEVELLRVALNHVSAWWPRDAAGVAYRSPNEETPESPPTGS